MRPPVSSIHHSRPARPSLRQNGWLTDEDVQPTSSAIPDVTTNEIAVAQLSTSTSLSSTPRRPASNLEVALVKQRLVNALGREGALLRLTQQLVPVVQLWYRKKRRRVAPEASSTVKQIVSAIRRSDAPFFDHWTAADISELARHAVQRQYRFEETIVLPYEPSRSCGVVVVLSGDVVTTPVLSHSGNGSSRRQASAPQVLGIAAAVGEGLCDATVVQAASPTVVVAIIPLPAFRKSVARHLVKDESIRGAVRSMRQQALLDQFYATPLGLAACSWLLAALPNRELQQLAVSGVVTSSTLLAGAPVLLDDEIMMVMRGQVRVSTNDGGCYTLYPGSSLGEFSCMAPQYAINELQLLEDGSIASLVVDAANGPCDVWTVPFSALCTFLASDVDSDLRTQIVETWITSREQWVSRLYAHQQQQHQRSEHATTIASALRDVPCLAHCHDALIYELCAATTATFYPRGSYVVHEGTMSDALILIIQGTVEDAHAQSDAEASLVGRRTVMGEYFLTPSNWNTSFVARSHVDALVLPSNTAAAILEKHRALKQSLDVCVQGVDLLKRRVSTVPMPPPSASNAGDSNTRIGSADSSPTPPVSSRGRRPTSTRKSFASTSNGDIGASVGHSLRDRALALWSLWFEDVQQKSTHSPASPSHQRHYSSSAQLVVSGRLQIVPPRHVQGPVWSTVRSVTTPLGYYSDASLVQLLSTPACYKTCTMLLRRGVSSGDVAGVAANDEARHQTTPIPLQEGSAVFLHEDSMLSNASLKQTKNMQHPATIETLGAPAQLFGQSANAPFLMTLDDLSGPTDWNFPAEIVTQVQTPFRPRPPSPPMPPATPQRPHTTGGTAVVSSTPSMQESTFMRSTIIGAFSPRPPRVASPGRPLTTGSLYGSSSSNRATPTQQDESAKSQPLTRATSQDPPSRPGFATSGVTSPPMLQVTMLQLDASQNVDDMVTRAISPSSTLAQDNPQSNRRNDPIARERTLSVTTVNHQRTLRPFSAQSRGQPSPMDRMVHQRSSVLEEMNSAQPDSIWNTFLSFDSSSGVGMDSRQPSLAVETIDDDPQGDQGPHRAHQRAGVHVVAHPLSTMDDDDGDMDYLLHGSPPPKKSNTKAELKQKPRPKPVVLLVHVIGCHNLAGCDSLVEPVVQVTGPGGKVFMTTPSMSNLANPTWTIEQSSFITVLLQRDELRFTVRDNCSGPEGEVLCLAAMQTSDLESVSGTGSRKIYWTSPSGQQLQSTLSLRVMVTCPENQPGADSAENGASQDTEDTRYSGSYSVVLGMCDLTLNATSSTVANTPVTASLSVDDRLILSCDSEWLTTLNSRSRSASAVFPLETSSTTFSCEGGVLEICFSRNGDVIGYAVASVDDLAFSGLGLRTLNIAATKDGAAQRKGSLTKRSSLLGAVRIFVLQVSAPQGRLQQETQSSGEPLLVMSVRSFDGGENNNVPWLPDPFVCVARASSTADVGGGAGQLLVRSSLVFSDARPEWSVRDASCVLRAKDDDFLISIFDNDNSNRVAEAIVSITATTHGRLHLESRFNKLSGTGAVTVDVARVPLVRIGAAVKKVVLRNQDPNSQDALEEADQGPPILMIHVASCSALRADNPFNESAVDPIVTARFDHSTRHMMRTLTRFHSPDPTWSTVDGAAFAVDLSSCSATDMTPRVVFEVWNGSVGPASNLIGSATVTLRTLASCGKQAHVLPLRPASDAVVTIETLLTYAGMVPFGIVPARDTELLLSTLALLDEEDVSSPITPKPALRDDDFFLPSDSFLRTNGKSESFIRRVVPIKISVLGCNHLSYREGHPFIVTQQGGNVLHTTPVALLGDMRNPIWKPNSATSLVHPLPIAPATKRFVDDASLTFVVMWQHGHEVSELARASVSLASLLNSGNYLRPVAPPSPTSSIIPTMLKAIELRLTPTAAATIQSADPDAARPLLRLMLNHEEL